MATGYKGLTINMRKPEANLILGLRSSNFEKDNPFLEELGPSGLADWLTDWIYAPYART